MKKRTRTLLCLVLVVMLTVSMVIPAMAEQPKNTRGTGSDTSPNGFDYAWELTHTAIDSTASMRTTKIDTTVKVVVSSYVYDDLNGEYGYSETAEDINYRSATASAGRIFEINGVLVDGEVQGAVAQFWVAGILSQTIYEGYRDLYLGGEVFD